MRKLIIAVVVILCIGAGAWFFLAPVLQKNAEAAANPDSSAATAVAERRNISQVLEISGDVAPVFEDTIKSEVSGKVKRILVSPGDEVKQGQLLAEIDDTELQTERSSALVDIHGAELATEKTRRNYLRSKELFDKKLISEEVYQNLESDLRIAENELNKAQRRLQTVDNRLSKTQILSPADGTILTVDVLERSLVVGAQSVNSGTPIMFLANLSELLVTAHVNQIDVAHLSLKQPVKIKNVAFGDIQMDAIVNYIAPIASVKNNVKGFSIDILIENPHERLKPGMTVSVEVPVAKADDVVSIPVSGIFSEEGRGGKKVVYVRNSSGTTEKRRVRVGLTDLFHAEILDGLQPGEEILLVRPRDKPSGDKNS